MKAILVKELNSFFSSPVGYLVIAVYLLINGLFLWVFEGDFNILHAGFADLNAYFFLAPWIFIFLIPAITMRSFSEEIQSGTIELLKTKPVTITQIVLGKYFGALILAVIAILPTCIYPISIYFLGSPVGNLNIGTILGSFLGLLFLISAYTAIGVFASSLTKNQIIAFISAVCISFFMFYGFEAAGSYNFFGNLDYFIQQLGMYNHYTSIGKGVLDTRDLIYFGSISVLFLTITKINLAND